MRCLNAHTNSEMPHFIATVSKRNSKMKEYTVGKQKMVRRTEQDLSVTAMELRSKEILSR